MLMGNIGSKVREYALNYGDVVFIAANGVLKEHINGLLALIDPDLAMDIDSNEILNRTLDMVVGYLIPTAIGVVHEVKNSYDNKYGSFMGLGLALFSAHVRLGRNLIYYFVPYSNLSAGKQVALYGFGTVVDLVRPNSPGHKFMWK